MKNCRLRVPVLAVRPFSNVHAVLPRRVLVCAGLLMIVGGCFAQHSPDAKRLKQLRAVEALLEDGRLTEAETSFRNLLQNRAAADVSTGVAADLLGVALLDQHRYAKADELISISIGILSRTAPGDSRVARTQGHLAEARWAQGRLADAQALSERALVVQSSALRPDDPEILTTLQNPAAIHHDRGHYQLATKYLMQAISAAAEGEPMRDLWRARVLHNTASVQINAGKPKAARETSLRALAILEGLASADPSLLISIQTCVGLAEARLKKQNSAQLWIERLTRVAEAQFGASDHRYAAMLVNRAAVQEALGLDNVAEQSLRSAAAIQIDKLGPTSPVVGRTLLKQAAVLTKLGRNSEAATAEDTARSLLREESCEDLKVSIAQLNRESMR
jgi:tetratricopeptide (TPR) repeat protein